nr:MAG: RNA-dependent RNA polymerase [Jingmen bat bunyavirus 1]
MESSVFSAAFSQAKEGNLNMADLTSEKVHFRPFSCRNLEIAEDTKHQICIKVLASEEQDAEFHSTITSMNSFGWSASDELIKLSAEDVRDLPHSVLLESLQLGNGSLFRLIGNPEPSFDSLCPDFVEIHDKRALIVELKTHKEDFWDGISDHWLSEQWKYWPALSKKKPKDWTIVYGTVFAFRNRVFFPQFLGNLNWSKLMRNLHVCWAMQQFIYSRASLRKFTDEPLPAVLQVREKISKLTFGPCKDDLHVGLELSERVSSEQNQKHTLLNFHRIVKRECLKTIETDKRRSERSKVLSELAKRGCEEPSGYEADYRIKVREVLDTYGCRSREDKSVVQVPFWSVLNTGWNTDKLTDSFFISESCAESRLWAKYLHRKMGTGHEIRLDVESLENDQEVAHLERSQRFVEKMTVSVADEKVLALKGVRGKRFCHHYSKKLVKEESQKGFSLECDTHDIDCSVNLLLSEDSVWLGKTTCQEELLNLLLIEYDSLAGGFQESRSDFEEFAETLRLSKFFRACRVLEGIVSEVNYSRQTNLKDVKEFVFKKVPGVDMLVMIVPTRSDRHIFFSVLSPKSSVEAHAMSPFKKPIDAGDFWVSEFISLDQDRISHLLNCSHKLLSIFMQKFQTNWPETFSQSTGLEAWRKECAFSALAFLEDKAQTSSALLQIRYAYMDLFSPVETLTHPLKILNKMPVIIRSRLLVWIINRVISAFNTMYHIKLTEGLGAEEISESKESISRDRLKGMQSWISGLELRSVSHMLDLSYLGHLHNKEEGNELQGNLQIFSKVAKEELALRTCDKELLLGLREPRQGEMLKSHEFSFSCVSIMARSIKARIIRRISEKFPRQDFLGCELTWYLCKRLSELSLKNLATMKASAWNLRSDQCYSADDKDEQNRVKVMVAMHELLQSGTLNTTSVLDLALEALDLVEKRGNKGVLVNLFKKLQLGGVREIFVLTFVDRLIIYVLESISRSLCELMDNEMLTKGDAKIMRSDDHVRQVQERLSEQGAYQLTGTTSGDATTWCQRFTMKIFGTFLLQLLPRVFHPLVSRILNTITNKRLQLPHNLLSLWLKHEETVSFDPSMNEMKRQFLGQSASQDLLETNSRMLKNRSNFMQGIMHYTSSLMHSAYLHLLSNMIYRDLKKQGFDGVITTKCSSDDSSFMITVISDDRDRLKRLGPVFIRRALTFVNNFYWSFGAKSSEEKTTLSVLDMLEEFNSVWLVRNTVVMPLIKFVASAFRTPPFSRLDGSLKQASISRGQLLSSGASFELLNIVQKEQMFAHYKSLGLFSIANGCEVYSKIKECGSPFLGFFTPEPKRICGLLGHDFAYYTHLKLQPDKAGTHMKFYAQKGADHDENLDFRSLISIGPGSLKRYKDFCKQLQAQREQVEEHFESNPEKLFEEWVTVEDAIMSLKLKAMRYEVAECFSGVKDSTTFNRAAYLLTSKVFVERDWFDTSKPKRTWLHLLKKYISTESVPAIIWRKTFNLSDLYDEILNILAEESSRKLVCCPQKRNLVVSRNLRTYEGPIQQSLLQCIKHFWFGKWPENVSTECDLQVSWGLYKAQLSWLRDSIDETVVAGDFRSRVSLCNYIMAYEQRRKNLIVLCPMRLNTSTEMFIRKAVRWNQWPGMKLKGSSTALPVKFNFLNPDLPTSLQLLSLVSNICCLPKITAKERDTGKEDLLPSLLLKNLSHNEKVKTLYSRLNFLEREARECIKCLKFYSELSKPLSLKERRAKLNECVRETGSSYIHYNTRQKWAEGKWAGPFSLDMIIDGEKYNVIGRDECLSRVRVSSREGFLRTSSKLCKILIDHGVTHCKQRRNQDHLYVNLITGRQTRLPDNMTIPLFIEPDLDKFINLPKDPVLKFETNYHSVKLVEAKTNTTLCIARLHRAGGFLRLDCPILSDSFSNLILPSSLLLILKKFCSNEPLEAQVAQLLLRDLPTGLTENHKVLEEWLRFVIKQRLKRKGYNTDPLPESVLEQVLTECRDDRDEGMENYYDIIKDAELDDDEIMACLKEMDEEESGSKEADNPSAFSLEDGITVEEYEVGELNCLALRQVVEQAAPTMLCEKNWLDSLLVPLSTLSKDKLEQLFTHKLPMSEASEDLRILANFMGWRLVVVDVLNVSAFW